MARNQDLPQQTERIETPIQFDRPQIRPALVELSPLIRLPEAREAFDVSGAGLTAAVIDSGLRTTHVDFVGRVPAQRNFTSDNGGDPNDASDGDGHGTNVAGIIAANGIHRGVAPGAGIVPLKALSNSGSGTFQAIEDALQWVIDNQAAHSISAVCMSLSDSGNYSTDTTFSGDTLRTQLLTLKNSGVAVVVAAGNDYFTHGSMQGMAYPSILRECISVGAVYDANVGGFSYQDGARALSTGPDRITPFSQRLHERVNPNTRTDIFAPGAPVTSSGIANDNGESIQHGTSQATPVITGVVLLMQEFYQRTTGSLPPVDDLVMWMRSGGVIIRDGDDEDDNVLHTNLDFIRVDVFAALEAIRRHLQVRLLTERVAFTGHYVAAASAAPPVFA